MCDGGQGRNQLGTPGVAKSFLRGPNFLTMSNSFDLCSTHFSRREKKFVGGRSPPGYGPDSGASRFKSASVVSQ